MNLETILQFLDGRKASIYGLIVLTLNFLALKQVIDNDTNLFIAMFVGVALGVVEYKTPQVLGGRSK